MTTRQAWKPWTKEDKARLIKRVAGIERFNADLWREIAAEFPDRSLIAVKQQHYEWKRLSNGGQPRTYYNRVVNPQYVPSVATARMKYQDPVDLPPHPTITSFIFGDPLPGRSALDRKRQGLPA